MIKPGFRHIVTLSILLCAVLGIAQPAAARPLALHCSAYTQSGICSPAFALNQQLAIQPQVAFVWLRQNPSSAAAVVATVIWTSKPALVVLQFPEVWDGYQNWWNVGLVSNSALRGWVEQASLHDLSIIAPTPAGPPAAAWKTPFTATISSALPFVWIRSTASSEGPVVSTLFLGNRFTVLGTPQPEYDGRQWWWYVRAITSAGRSEGYIEQAAIN